MNAKQTATLLGRIVEHGSSFYSLPTADAQWAIQNPKEFISLSVEAAKNRSKREPTSKDRTMKVLRLATPVVPPTPKNTPFKADETFFKKKNKFGVKLAEHSWNFNTWFRGKIEEDGTPNPLTPYALTKFAYSNEIIRDLGGEEAAETSLADMWALMEGQPNGKEGVLLTNATNIFYARDKYNVLRSVGLYWDGFGWFASADLDDSCWSACVQVFSRK